MRALWLIALLVACKGKGDKDKPVITVKKTVIYLVTSECERAIEAAGTAPLDARPRLLLDNCPVCERNDWKPLLSWNAEPEAGGPKREQIEKIMVDCDAFCTGDSKLKFMSAVDKVRGKGVDTPWRGLANACKTKVNGAPDDRFMSAPFFALDRIARGVMSAPGGGPDSSPLVTKLGAVELPLPAATISGAGVVLPDADGATAPSGTLAITVLGDSIHVGRLPRGKLTHAGIAVDFGKEGYPGDAVPLDQLAAKLTALVGSDKAPLVLLAPSAMPAAKLVDIIAAAAPIAPVNLSAAAPESPEGWQLPGAIPIALEAGKDLAVTNEMKVQDLARDLAARVARKETRVGVTKQ
jgi:hypothetical protein